MAYYKNVKNPHYNEYYDEGEEDYRDYLKYYLECWTRYFNGEFFYPDDDDWDIIDESSINDDSSDNSKEFHIFEEHSIFEDDWDDDFIDDEYDDE